MSELYPGMPFSPQATLTSNIGAADSIIPVSDVSAFPDAPNLATIGTDEGGETILYTAKTSTALSGCQRGVEGTAKAWTTGELIGRNFTAKDHNDMIAALKESAEQIGTAEKAATDAKAAAEEAKTQAGTAGTAAEAAQQAATSAESKAGEAQTAAQGAASEAQAAKTAAAAAASTAETASTAASTAQTAAETAASQARTAATAAKEAKETAQKALETAEAAGGLYPQIIVTVEDGASVKCVKGEKSYQAQAEGSPVVFTVDDYGTWTVSAEKTEQSSNVVEVNVDDVKQYAVALSFFNSTITVTVPAGSEVTCSNGDTVLKETATGGTAVFQVHKAGKWEIKATLGGQSASGSVQVDSSGQSLSLTLSYVHIYGVSWDGSASTTLSRTDDAALFVEPAPAVGTASGSSPFDNCLPWSGMQKVTDGTQVLVSIPKFWVKVQHDPLRIQIADQQTPGYQVSPAHRDRGDGVGERDVVYIGRYECGPDYGSKSGQTPKVSTALATFRSGISALGAEYWQADYDLQLTLYYLYIVEFADWNSQAKIGRGYVDGNSAPLTTGGTDTMTYHTGRPEGVDGKTAVQYRWIENPWGSAREWRDGIIFSDANICTYKNPEQFTDTYNSTGAEVRTNKRPTSGGYISAWGHDEDDAAFIYPSAVAGAATTHVPDYCNYFSGVRALYVGGNCSNGDYAGLFFLYGNNAPTNTDGNLGSRLQKLPRAA